MQDGKLEGVVHIHSLYIKIWFTVVKETEKTCSAVAEKWLMLQITPSPR